MLSAYKKYFRLYHQLAGCTPRSEYWWVFLVNFLEYLLWLVLYNVCFPNTFIEPIVLWLGIIWVIVNIVPMFCLTVRRFHDVGISGWWRVLTFLLGGSIVIKLLPSNQSSKFRK